MDNGYTAAEKARLTAAITAKHDEIVSLAKGVMQAFEALHKSHSANLVEWERYYSLTHYGHNGDIEIEVNTSSHICVKNTELYLNSCYRSYDYDMRDGDYYFHGLTLGKLKDLMNRINNGEDICARKGVELITESNMVVEHLKQMCGVIEAEYAKFSNWLEEKKREERKGERALLAALGCDAKGKPTKAKTIKITITYE